MASSVASRFLFSYQKLTKDDYPVTSPDHQPLPPPAAAATFYDPSVPTAAAGIPRAPYPARWVRLRRSGSSNRTGWWRTRRPRVRVIGLRRLLSRRVRLLRAAYRKVVNRFKEGKAHFGDLFAGNYMFLQVNPTSAATAAKASAYIQAQQRTSSKTMPGGAGAGGGNRLQGLGVPTTVAGTGRYYVPYGLTA